MSGKVASAEYWLIWLYCFGPIWLRNKLIDLLLLPFGQKDEKEVRTDSNITKSNYNYYMVLE